MLLVPAGTVTFGEDVPDKKGRIETVVEFWIDRHEVTNRQFATFVAATGYVTDAERQGGGAVFVAPSAVSGMNPENWWRFVSGADWRHPSGPSATIAGDADKPVVQVTFNDAQAYARWTGKQLPDELQWERAARFGQRGRVDPGRWAYDADGKPIANTWQGPFPIRNLYEDGHGGLAPVGCFPANRLGLHDMIGNAWEWTRSVGDRRTRIIKGGSFLCASNYCANFKPVGLQAQEADLPTSHVGFRTISATSTANRPLSF